MCQYCEQYQTILENENSVVFIVENRLILQDKTAPKFNPEHLSKDYTGEDMPICYDSKWVRLSFCPFCKEPCL